MSSPVPIVQVLVLFEEGSARELAPALWATFLEVERFYNQGERRASFDRYYISRHRPPTSLLDAAWRAFAGLFGKGKGADDAVVSLSRQVSEQSFLGRTVEADPVKGRYTGTVDQEGLWVAARSLLGDAVHGKNLLIVTDREITPPPEWRYIIWDGGSTDAVISVAPTDPKYWRERDPQRLATIKHRARVANLSVSGQFLGLERCENPFCFLYRDVDSVTTLDHMTTLGEEHGLGGLTNLGFDSPVEEVSVVQRAVKKPPEEGWTA